MARWTAVTTRAPKGTKNWAITGGAYLVANVKALTLNKIWVETTHPSWWNYRDRRGREHDGPKVTHWMPLPKAPRKRP